MRLIQIQIQIQIQIKYKYKWKYKYKYKYKHKYKYKWGPCEPVYEMLAVDELNAGEKLDGHGEDSLENLAHRKNLKSFMFFLLQIFALFGPWKNSKPQTNIESWIKIKSQTLVQDFIFFCGFNFCPRLSCLSKVFRFFSELFQSAAESNNIWL